MGLKQVIVFLALVSLSLGQQVTPGPCPEATPISNFDINTLYGHWYEVKRYEIDAIPGVDCVEGTYSEFNETFASVDAVGKNFTVDGVENLRYTGRLHEVYPGANTGVLGLSIDGEPLEEILILLDFESTAYSVSWSCYYIPEFDVNAQYLWVHSKTRTLNTEDEAKIDAVIADHGLDASHIRDTLQDEELCAFNH